MLVLGLPISLTAQRSLRKLKIGCDSGWPTHSWVSALLATVTSRSVSLVHIYIQDHTPPSLRGAYHLLEHLESGHDLARIDSVLSLERFAGLPAGGIRMELYLSAMTRKYAFPWEEWDTLVRRGMPQSDTRDVLDDVM